MRLTRWAIVTDRISRRRDAKSAVDRYVDICPRHRSILLAGRLVEVGGYAFGHAAEAEAADRAMAAGAAAERATRYGTWPHETDDVAPGDAPDESLHPSYGGVHTIWASDDEYTNFTREIFEDAHGAYDPRDESAAFDPEDDRDDR